MKKIFLLFALCLGSSVAKAQVNIDFESGNLSNWIFYVGTTVPTVTTPTNTPPVGGRHTLTAGSGVDPYGAFPIVDAGFPSDPTFPSCNANNYSFRLGNDTGSRDAERARYVVHVPAGVNNYHLRYRYALVLQDWANPHVDTSAPKLIVGVTDSVSGSLISCATTNYMYQFGYGFHMSTVAGWPDLPTVSVAYRDWSTASIDLSGKAGKTFYIDFITADCQGGPGHAHSGYAYLDFVDICSNVLYPCYPGTISSLKAPSGFASYAWYGPGSSSPIATGQSPTIASPSVTSTYTVVAQPISHTYHSVTETFGCADSFYVTVDPIIPTITGTLNVCVGYTTPLTGGGGGGGTWSSSNTAVAFVGSSSGIVTGEGAGIATITYTLAGFGCTTTVNVTVNAIDIIGPTTVCKGGTMLLTDATAGGIWSSGSPSFAMVGSSSGVVTGIGVGTATITYTTSTGCVSTLVVTVLSTPTFSGTPVICVGYTYNQPHTGTGTWSSSATTIATVDPVVGGIYGVSAGTAVITYGTTGCYITEVVTVNPIPSPIIGTVNICVGGTVTLSDASTGGSWISISSSIASVGSTGLVTALTDGTTTISYYYPATSCGVSIVATVNPAPKIINGPSTVCVGHTITLTDSVTGGTWASSPSAVGTIDGVSGIFTGISAGTAIVIYTTMCGTVTATVTVNPNPAPIVAPSVFCQGGTYTLTDPTSGGTWTSLFPAVGTIDPVTGVLNCPSYSSDTIYYTLSTGCYAKLGIFINIVAAPITGPLELCVGSIDTLYSSPGGTWSSSTPAVGTVSAPLPGIGIVHGLTTGTTTISFTLNAPECAVTAIVTVDPVPGSITGTLHVCAGSTTALADAPAGGTWSSSIPTVGTIGTSGVVTGITPGTTIITYTTHGICTATTTVTVDSIPVISGTLAVCHGLTTTLNATPSGGTWISGTPSVASIGSSTGIVTGGTIGTATITYTSPAGCVGTVIVTVYATPAAITGTLTVCVGSSTTLSDVTTSGTWSSSNPSVGTVNASTGAVTGIAFGTTTISYTDPHGCYVTAVFTVNPLPAPIVVDAVCVGSTTTAVDATMGGTWSSSIPSVGTIGTSGVVTGISAGTTTITYTLATGCYITATETVNPGPAPIMGIDSFCFDVSTLLTDSTAGGTWSSSDVSIALIGTAGYVTGLGLGGTSTITYTLGTGCYATVEVTVLTTPAVDTIAYGNDTVCVGLYTPISDVTPGGVWSSSDPGIAYPSVILGVGEVLVGVSPGTVVLSYTVANECGPTTVMTIMTVLGVPAVDPITGMLGVCSGYTTQLYGTPPGGVWTSSNPAVASIGSSTGIVDGIGGSSVTITYTVTNMCGSTFVTANVLVNMAPYITANFVVACQTLITAGAADMPSGPPVISGNSVCINTCDSSTVRYYANGVGGSAFTWDIAGGTVINTYPPDNDSIDVFWQGVGLIGSIVLHDTFQHCIDSASACIKIVEKPTANFSVSSTFYCLGDNIVFYDLSTGDPSSPIVYYHWDFGDGTGSSVMGGATHMYSTPGTYNVTLTVKNQCNCTNSFSIKLTIDKNAGPSIYCPSIVCDSEIVKYYTKTVCTTYDWTVDGGTIISGAGTSSILVRWDNVDSAGFGYVTLSTPGCAKVCDAPTTIKVPVILQSPVIFGNDTACANRQYYYKLPLWPATQYAWGVLGDTLAVNGCHNDYQAVISFSTVGIDTIHAWYQNRIKLCGATVNKVVVVLPPTGLLGTTTVCANVSYTYSVSGGYSADWILKDYKDSVFTGVLSSTTFTYAFTAPGTYILYANGGFCADPLTITVLPIPTLVDGVAGEDTVCLNRIYSYSAYNDVPGNIYNWEVVGGTLAPSSGTNTVTVTWTSSGTKQLKVWRTGTSAPFCPGQVSVINIIQEVVNPHVTGDPNPCANSFHNYSANYTRGEVYDWVILPTTAGSVITGNHAPNITVLWNNTDTVVPAIVVVKVRKCDTTVNDTLHVTVALGPPITVTADIDTICPGSEIVFTATAGDGLYLWNFDNASDTLEDGHIVHHIFPVNPTSGDVIYRVSATAVFGSGTCPATGSDTVDIVVHPAPSVYLTKIDTFNCLPDTGWVKAIVSTNAGSVTYTWYGDHPGSDSTYNMYTPGSYYCIVTAADGCTDTSNVMSYGCYRDTIHGAPCLTPGSVTHTCNTLTFTGGLPGHGGIWVPDVGGVASPHPYNANPWTDTVNQVGVYPYHFVDSVTHCQSNVVYGYIYMLPEFGWQVRCGTGGTHNVYFTNYTTYLSGITPTYQWFDLTSATPTVPFSTSVNPVVAWPVGSSHTVRLTATCTLPDLSTEVCNFDRAVFVPPALTVDFSYIVPILPSSVCEKVPVLFTPITSEPVISYYWTFGDSATLVLAGAQREYTWNPAGGPFFNNYDAKLYVQDVAGCRDSADHFLTIYKNTLSGNLGPGSDILCSSAAPDILLWNFTTGPAAIDSYVWSAGTTTLINTLGVSQSGSYWVTVHDALQCQSTSLPRDVTVIQTPPAVIHAVSHYCVGEVLTLNGYVGTGVDYQWVRNGFAITSLGYHPVITQTSRPVGVDTYQLIIRVYDTATGMYCFNSSALDIISVLPLPAPPAISGPHVVNCLMYELQLSASEPVSGTYNWSDGAYGSTDIIYMGGPYRVWFTDLYGCTSHRDTLVPLSPETYSPYFPAGCYDLCTSQLKLRLYGPPCASFPAWAWLKDGSVDAAGTSSGFIPEDITGSGDYNWVIYNGLCTDTSETMSLTTERCDCGQDVIRSASAVCDDSNPAGYTITITLVTHIDGTSFVLGTDIGPITPFYDSLVSHGSFSIPFSFTTLLPDSLVDSVTIEVIFTYPDGTKCFQKLRIPLPHPCNWEAERGLDQTHSHGHSQAGLSMTSALMVFPNPSSGDVTISYDYGQDGNSGRILAVYDMMGRKVGYIIPDDIHGTWKLNTTNWVPGMYIVRMEGDGRLLQSQRMVLTH